MEQKAKTVSTFANLPFEVTDAAEKPAQMGLVTLETDLTIETEMRHFLSGAPGHRRCQRCRVATYTDCL